MLSLSCSRGLLPAARPSGLWTVGVVVVVGKSGLRCQPLVKSLVSLFPTLTFLRGGIHWLDLFLMWILSLWNTLFLPTQIFFGVGSVLLSKYTVSLSQSEFLLLIKNIVNAAGLWTKSVLVQYRAWWRRCIPEYKRWQFAKANTGREAIFGKEKQFLGPDVLRFPTCHRQNVGMKKGTAMPKVLCMFVPPISLFPASLFKRKELSLTLYFPSLLCLGVLFLLVFLLPFQSRK